MIHLDLKLEFQLLIIFNILGKELEEINPLTPLKKHH